MAARRNGALPVETVPVADLKPHPQNYRDHPDDQLAHIAQSMADFGVYRNVVVARDGTILAGHGVVAAAKKVGTKRIPVVRLNLAPDSPKALKLLAADNEIGKLARVDDRALSELLRRVAKSPGGLVGTGYDAAMLANLVTVTRPSREIPNVDTAGEWVGMPEFVPGRGAAAKLTINFDTVDDRDRFVKETGISVLRGESAWWPPRKPQDLRSVSFEG